MHMYNGVGAASSGDIDMLLGHPSYTSESKSKPPYIKTIVAEMEKDGFVTDSLSAGESKFMVHTMSCMFVTLIFHPHLHVVTYKHSFFLLFRVYHYNSG